MIKKGTRLTTKDGRHGVTTSDEHSVDGCLKKGRYVWWLQDGIDAINPKGSELPLSMFLQRPDLWRNQQCHLSRFMPVMVWSDESLFEYCGDNDKKFSFLWLCRIYLEGAAIVSIIYYLMYWLFA